MAVVAGLSERRLAKIGGRLEVFAGEVFEGALVRSEQRKWSGGYLRGLMLEGRRKSIEPDGRPVGGRRRAGAAAVRQPVAVG